MIINNKFLLLQNANFNIMFCSFHLLIDKHNYDISCKKENNVT